MANKKQYTTEQKITILRELLEDRVPIGQLADKHNVHVNDIYAWKKKLFENASIIFEKPKAKQLSDDKNQIIVNQLEAQLKKRDEAISYLLNDNITLKKSMSGVL